MDDKREQAGRDGQGRRGGADEDRENKNEQGQQPVRAPGGSGSPGPTGSSDASRSPDESVRGVDNPVS